MATAAGRLALVTGAGRVEGLGYGLCAALAARGYRVLLAARDAEVARRLAVRLSTQGGAVSALPLDLTDAASVTAAAEHIREGIPVLASYCDALGVRAFAEGLDVSEDDVLLYLALREAAHQRLFAHVPWLREHLIGAVTDYARGLEINAQQIQDRVQEQLRGIDPTNP